MKDSFLFVGCRSVVSRYITKPVKKPPRIHERYATDFSQLKGIIESDDESDWIQLGYLGFRITV